MFAFTSEPINPAKLSQQMKNSHVGAFVCFEGWVRDRNNDQDVAELEYEGTTALAENEFQKLEDEMHGRFDIFDIHCTHRVGTLAIGDIAVWIGVTAKHRRDAFAACEWIIDELKQRLPIWKKEHYTTGSSEWINHA